MEMCMCDFNNGKNEVSYRIYTFRQVCLFSRPLYIIIRNFVSVSS